MADLYFIRNCGCDDETRGLARLTDEQFDFLKKIIENLNKNSTYGCMPTMYVYKIDEDMVKEATDEDDDRIMYLDDREYVLADGVYTWDDEFNERMVIGK